MAKVAVPVIRLSYADEDAFTNEIVEEIMQLGFWEEDSITFTGRIVVPIVPDLRLRVAERLRALLPEQQAENLLWLLRSNEWSVSFFVDCW